MLSIEIALEIFQPQLLPRFGLTHEGNINGVFFKWIIFSIYINVSFGGKFI